MIFVKILISISSTISILFGIWHFFVPKIWNWYSYINKSATELIVAVRAINVFFSAALVIFGIMNILIVWLDHTSKLSLIVIISGSCIMWILRTMMQLIYPQGSINPVLQYGMLVAFFITLAMYVTGLILVIMIYK